MFGRRRHERHVKELNATFDKAGRERPELWRMLEARPPRAYLTARGAEVAEEFAASAEEAQVGTAK
jgi:hypothetical protein